MCGSGQYQLSLLESKLRVRKDAEKHDLTAAKVLLTANGLRRYVLPVRHNSSVGFYSGALGANNMQVTFQSAAANPAFS
jgi:hypothetical protein